MITGSTLNSPLSPRLETTPSSKCTSAKAKTLYACFFFTLAACVAVTLSLYLTSDNRVDSAQLQGEYEDDAEVLHLGDFEICSWQQVPVAESVMVNGQAMNFSTPVIQGETCDTGEIVILVIGTSGVHGSIGTTRVTAESENVSRLDEEDMEEGLSLDDDSPKTEAWAKQWRHDQEKLAALAQHRRQLLTPGLVDVHLHLDLDKHMTDTLGDYGAAEYAVELLAVVNRDVYYPLGFNLKVVSINLRDTYVTESKSTSDYLDVIQAEGLPANVNLVHSLSTRSLGGGVAYLGGLYSSSSYGYGVSGSLRGEFHKWDLVVVAHELGHNFGAYHTHDMTPQVDNCGNQCPADASGATIMSYCHLCSGGLNNIDYIFHEEVKKDILETYSARNAYLAARAECTDLSTEVPDVGVPFYLKTDQCLNMVGTNVDLCTLDSAWVRDTDSGSFRLVSLDDRGLCWQANCASSSVVLAACSDATSQQFDFQGAKLRSVECNSPVTGSSDLTLTLGETGASLQQWCAPDAPTATPAPTEAVPCENSNNGATDPYGDDCAWYDANPTGCGGYDDSDFRSNEMCCSCGGGFDPTQVTTAEPTEVTQEPTDVVTEQPTMATQEPTMATEEPTMATEEPTMATEEPTDAVITEQPTMATQEPTDAVVTEQPTMATQEPTDAVVTEQPTMATQEPTDAVVTEQPTMATQVPTTEQPSAATAEPTDAVVTSRPTEVTTSQPSATPQPTQATPEPTDLATPTPTTGEQCENSNDGATGNHPWNDDCSWYEANPWGCGNYNDNDFRSDEMCCVCGGGRVPGATAEPTMTPPPEEPKCYIAECGCAPFRQPWCHADAHQLTNWCAQSESNCQACNGAWCTSSSGPTDPTTVAPVTESPTTLSPTTGSPTTNSPTTGSPTTTSPTTGSPTESTTTTEDATGFTYEVMVTPQGRTCRNSGRIARHCRGRNACSESFCQQLCDDTDECLFYFFNELGRCHLYRECDRFRRPSTPGVTMRKVFVEPSTTSAETTSSPTSVETTVVETTSAPSWGQGVKLTHFWDCNGMACDAPTLQPWDLSKYVASPGYSPQNPDNHGGAVYGEKMWLVGAASDSMSELLGEHDPCCGSSSESSGCGKCVLMRVSDAVNNEWTALVMKKNRCPPWSNGCEPGNLHFDMAVPGYDNLQYSTANVCGMRDNTGFASQQASAVLGDWYNQFDNTAAAGASLCTTLPPQFQEGCELFSSWGWNRGDPNAEYRVVDCPEAFKAHVAAQFDADGVTTF